MVNLRIIIYSFVLSLSALGISGCSFLIGKALSGENIKPMGGNKFQVTYNGWSAESGWINTCKNLCLNKDFVIISQQYLSRPEGIPGWSGLVECSLGTSKFYNGGNKLSSE
jgi:hypothetical protein